MNVNRQDMADVLNATFGQPGRGKLDFNNAGRQALADRLRDALARNSVPHDRAAVARPGDRPAFGARYASTPA